MNTSELLASIDAEISVLKQVRNLLAGQDGTRGAFSGRRKRILSADARARIAAAQRKRWAKQKKAAKKTA